MNRTLPCRRRLRSLLALLLAVPGVAWAQAAEQPQNYFNDPFVQATHGQPLCPQPAGPEITQAQRLAESHERAERGTSCYRAGRCRLPNSYLYDAEIVPRVKLALEVDGRFNDTSVWVEGQRRWVWLKGCVRNAGQSEQLERLVRSIDDVEAVINELKVVPK